MKLVIKAFLVNEEVSCFEFSPDSKTILVGYEKNNFTLYDINSKYIIKKFKSDNYYGVSSIKFSPDGNFILLIHEGWYSGSLDMLELSTHNRIFLLILREVLLQLNIHMTENTFLRRHWIYLCNRFKRLQSDMRIGFY